MSTIVGQVTEEIAARDVELKRFVRGLEMFASVQPDMQIQTMLAYLYTALREGSNQKDIENLLGVSNASASRNIYYWTKEFKPGIPGKGFISQDIDPDDRRFRVVTLTPKGKTFARKMAESVKGKE